jgi:4-hydroxy-3-methylbut-2-enyl diphosphate reductase
LGVPSYLIEDAIRLDPNWLDGKDTVGITAGASAPETLVDEVINRLHELREISVETLSGVEENVRFKLPPELKDVPKIEAHAPVWGDA